MFMKAKRRTTKGGEGYIYFILCGSWRDSQGLTMRDELLNVGRHDDLALLRKRKYKFLCVSRSSRKAYKPIEGAPWSISRTSCTSR